MQITQPKFTAIATLLALSTRIAISVPLPAGVPKEAGLSEAKLKQIPKAMQKLIDDEKLAGVVIMVARQGRVVYSISCGKMDLKAGKPMRKDAIFRIYSMTKPITSAAAMILCEEGKFNIHDPLSKYIPAFKNMEVLSDPYEAKLSTVPAKREITILDLFRHTAGFTYGIFGNTALDKLYREKGILQRENSLKESVQKLAKLPLLYQPGTDWHYSVATDVLGYLIEVLSKQSLDAFLSERIFEPLGMKDTGFYVPEEKLERFATSYRPSLFGGLRVMDAPRKSQFRDKPALLSGGGGLVSTATDYMRFALMLLNRGKLGEVRLLQKQTVELMTQNHVPKEAMPIGIGPVTQKGVGFGFGFSVRVKTNVFPLYGKAGEYGWGGAASTHFWISPKDDLAVVALSQLMPFSPQVEQAVKPIVYSALKP